MKQWYLLEPGEAVCDGDEYFDVVHSDKWVRATDGVGTVLTPTSVPVRRKIEDAKELGTTHNGAMVSALWDNLTDGIKREDGSVPPVVSVSYDSLNSAFAELHQ